MFGRKDAGRACVKWNQALVQTKQHSVNAPGRTGPEPNPGERRRSLCLVSQLENNEKDKSDSSKGREEG